jgi:hypothetical protein
LILLIPSDVALQRKAVKPAGCTGTIEWVRKCLKIVKDLPGEGARGGQTFYMTASAKS